ncbi:restriction endonuclease [Paraburkholderia sp. BCC1876]|uniref:restriction endonuclease n=1 Tax=Paraburkholderia sp. BCC1876 TaxID=2676303 RepID=UPI0015923105|nr:restriction endonuclease [Paraburkholderia sp. BCC1876]
MSLPWRAYQQDVAGLFRSLGCSVEVEKEVAGARGIHVVDVLAETTLAGVGITWVIECKLWNTAIPKEKVLTLAQVASDVGADRAFLLSESGFQAGAIRVAQSTNITLTSLQELLDSARGELQKRELVVLMQDTHRLQQQMHDFFILDNGSLGPPAGADRESFLDLLAAVFELNSIALPRAQAGDFPVTMTTGGSLTRFSDMATFIAYARRELERVATCLAAAKQEVDNVRRHAGQLFSGFAHEVGDFLDHSGAILLANSVENIDQSQLSFALDCMKRVGDRAKELRTSVSGRASNALSRVMRALIDGPYLLLPQMRCEDDQWRKSRESVEAPLGELAALLRR